MKVGRTNSSFHQMVNLVRERDESEPVALPLGRDKKEESRRDRTVQVSGCFAGVLAEDFGKL